MKNNFIENIIIKYKIIIENEINAEYGVLIISYISVYRFELNHHL